MDKSHILEAIKRIAGENGGKAPGSQAFEGQARIRKSDWYPYLWLRWGDALTEAGFTANKLQMAISHDVLIQKYIELTRELKRLPVEGEIKRQARTYETFPSHSVFRKLGGKEKLLEALLRFCKEHPGNEDIITICENRKAMSKHDIDLELPTAPRTGFVYR
jgi:hypothetical protein